MALQDMDMLMAIATVITMVTVTVMAMVMEVNMAKGITQQRPKRSPKRG